MTAKLTVVVRSDLSAGQQAVQAMHAQRQFAADHPDVERSWFEQSNTLALLCVADEEALCQVLRMASDRGIRCSIFREPDIGDRMTAICLEPSEGARRLCRGFSLALKGR